jgi:hypothetical protein
LLAGLTEKPAKGPKEGSQIARYPGLCNSYPVSLYFALLLSFAKHLFTRGQEMKLQSDQIARLFAAGAVPIPPSFPQPGLVSVEPKGIRINKKDEPSVQIAHHRTPTQVTTYITSLREVAAIFLSDGFAAGEGPTWLLGEELREGEAATIQATLSKFKDGRPGTVFVSERAGVITQQECVYTAGEIAATPMSCTDYTC